MFNPFTLYRTFVGSPLLSLQEIIKLIRFTVAIINLAINSHQQYHKPTDEVHLRSVILLDTAT